MPPVIFKNIQEQLDHYKSQSKVNPQRENGHIRINNEVYDSLYKIPYKFCSTLPIILFILRQTWGWEKKVSTITGKQIQSNTPYQKMAIIRGLKEAEMRRIVIIERQFGKPSKILFNKYFDTWLTSNINITSYTDDTGNIQDTVEVEIESKPVTPEIPVTQKVLVPHELPTGNTDDTGSSNTSVTTHERSLHSPITNSRTNIYRTNIYNDILKIWNSQKIVVHKKLNNPIKKSIDKALKNYELGEITSAIITYGYIVTHPNEYRFTYKWTLQEFLIRENAITKFIDGEIARQNYKIDKEKLGKANVTTQPKRVDKTIDDFKKADKEQIDKIGKKTDDNTTTS